MARFRIVNANTLRSTGIFASPLTRERFESDSRAIRDWVGTRPSPFPTIFRGITQTLLIHWCMYTAAQANTTRVEIAAQKPHIRSLHFFNNLRIDGTIFCVVSEGNRTPEFQFSTELRKLIRPFGDDVVKVSD